MIRRSVRAATVVAIALLPGACGDTDPVGLEVKDQGLELTVLSGNDQSGTVGKELPQPVVVRVVDSRGRPRSGQIVNFVITEGGGSVFAGRGITNGQGLAQDFWTLGPKPGRNSLEARAVDSATGERLLFGGFQANGLRSGAGGGGEGGGDDGGGSASWGEVGTVSVQQSGASSWHVVRLTNTYVNPVVIMGPPSFNGNAPLVVRVRNVQSNRFEFQFDEWDYLDGSHTKETVSYLVAEAGTHLLEDGTPVQAGIASGVTHSWKKLSLDGFPTAPVVFSQLATTNEGDAATTRHRRVSKGAFQVRLQESEASDGRHSGEGVHWIALGKTTIGKRAEVGLAGSGVSEKWTSVDFEGSYPQPVLFGSFQEFDGGDAISLRHRGLKTSAVQLLAQEEQSRDKEIRHTPERVGYAVFAGENQVMRSYGAVTQHVAELGGLR
jgi:hypothetical protein